MARNVDQNERVILSTRAMCDSARTLVPEGHTFVDEVLGIQKLLPDLQGCAYDMALRGVHFRRCLDAGLLPVVKQHKSDGAARDRFIENAKVAGGTRDRVEVQAVGGRACVRELAADGEWQTYPLERVKTMRRGKPGEYRWYNQYRLPPVLGGGTVTVRLDQTVVCQPHGTT